MEITYLSLLGGFAMLVFGVIDYAILVKLLYTPLRDRYEKAKVTGSQGTDPAKIWNLLRMVNFLIFPLAGFVVGEPVLRPFFG